MNILEHVEITFDHEYTEKLHNKVAAKFGSDKPRNATHASDLYTCLLKAWLKKHIPREEWLGEDDPLLMWGQGLMFEDLVSEGDRQKPMAYCFKCVAVSSPSRDVNGMEQDVCPVCNTRWLIGTPDYKVDGVIHEAKQTKKSQRRGPSDAPWWIEQLATYILFQRRATPSDPPTWGRIVANWLMGDYGDKRKGFRPRPPTSALDAFRVTFLDDAFWPEWESELARRKGIVEGDERPLLSFPGDVLVDSPRFSWECSSCQVGKVGGCPNWVWDDAGREIVEEGEEV